MERDGLEGSSTFTIDSGKLVQDKQPDETAHDEAYRWDQRSGKGSACLNPGVRKNHGGNRGDERYRVVIPRQGRCKVLLRRFRSTCSGDGLLGEGLRAFGTDVPFWVNANPARWAKFHSKYYARVFIYLGFCKQQCQVRLLTLAWFCIAHRCPCP